MSMMSWEEVKDLLLKHIDDREFIFNALKEGSFASPQMGAMPEELCDDEEVVFYLVTNGSHKDKELSYASDRLKKDKEFIRKLITEAKYNIPALASCDKSVLSDREFVLSLDLPNNAGSPYQGMLLEYLSPELQDDEEIVYQCCQSETGSLRYASKRLKNDKDFVLSILKGKFSNWTGSIDYILQGEPIMQNPEFVREAFDITNTIDFEEAPDEIKNDLLLVLKALNGRYMPYYYVEDAMMCMYYVYSPFSGPYSLHISDEILKNPMFARLIADQYFSSEIGRTNIDKYPVDNITDVYDIIEKIAYEGHCYWYNEKPESVFDFTEEIKLLEKEREAKPNE